MTQALHAEAFLAWFEGSRVTQDDVPKVMYHATYVRELRGGGTVGDITAFDRRASVDIIGRQESMDTIGVWFSDNPAVEGGAGMYARGEGAVIYPVYLRIRNPKYYASFNEFLDEMHLAAGRDPATRGGPGQPARGIGSAEELHQKLKAEGYDGIVFGRTYTKQVLERIEQVAQKVRAAKDAEWAVPKRDRLPLTARRERYEQELREWHAKLRQNESTEFDEQQVWVAFEPTQIKSAIGNSGAFDPECPDMTDAVTFQPRLKRRMA